MHAKTFGYGKNNKLFLDVQMLFSCKSFKNFNTKKELNCTITYKYNCVEWFVGKFRIWKHVGK
jgi:hypothetical protein